MILAGDIGGTKVNLGLYREISGQLESLKITRYQCCNYSGIDQILDVFMRDIDCAPEIVCFGVAGAVIDGSCHLTNLDWNIDSSIIRKSVGANQVLLINDLAALACSVLFLGSNEIEVLQKGIFEDGIYLGPTGSSKEYLSGICNYFNLVIKPIFINIFC